MNIKKILNKNKAVIKLALLSVFFIIIDQLVKLYVIRYYPELVSINQGIVFGYIQNIYIKYFLIFVGFILIILLIKKTKLSDFDYQISISLILAGALSNLFDRISNGYIIDFIKLPSYLSFWPTFNLSDIFIVVGVVIYAYKAFRDF